MVPRVGLEGRQLLLAADEFIVPTASLALIAQRSPSGIVFVTELSRCFDARLVSLTKY